MARYKDGRSQGFYWVPNRVLTEFGKLMGPAGLAVYSCIAMHTSGKGRTAHPSHATIAHETGLNKRTVIRAMHRLIEIGLLKRQNRVAQGGLKISNIYTLVDPPEGDLFSENRPAQAPETEANGSDIKSPPDGASVSLPSDIKSPPLVHWCHYPSDKNAPSPKGIEQDPLNNTQEQDPIIPPRKRDDLFDAVTEVTGSDPKIHGSHIGKVCKTLRSAEPPYTPEEVRECGRQLTDWVKGYPSLGLLEQKISNVRAPPLNGAVPKNLRGRPETDAERCRRLFGEDIGG